ncbi:unnamed protein product [Wickerhamomyces anomalus]
MLDTLPIRHRKPQQQQQQQLHHHRIHSSPAQVFENPPSNQSSKWQILKHNEKQIYEHTNKSDDSLELMPTIAMGYENSINKKLQRHHGELRITGDGYFFDHGYDDNDRDYRYGPRQDDWRYNQQYQQNNKVPLRPEYNRNRVHPVYDQGDDRYGDDGSNRGDYRTGRFDSRDDFPRSVESSLRPPVDTCAVHRSKRSYGELRPVNSREKSFERVMSSERIRSPSHEIDHRKASRNSEYYEPVAIPSEPPLVLDEKQLNPQELQPIMIKSPKKKGFFKKMFTNNDGKLRKKSKSKKLESSLTPSTNLIQEPGNIPEEGYIQEDVISDNAPIDNGSSIVTFIENFPIISNIFNKIDEIPIPHQSKLMLKALLLFWILYEINTLFEIIGDWFRMFGSVFTGGDDESSLG